MMAAETAPERRWGTLDEAAAEQRCSKKTIRRGVASGDIYAERFGPRRILVDLNSIKGRPLSIAKAER